MNVKNFICTPQDAQELAEMNSSNLVHYECLLIIQFHAIWRLHINVHKMCYELSVLYQKIGNLYRNSIIHLSVMYYIHLNGFTVWSKWVSYRSIEYDPPLFTPDDGSRFSFQNTAFQICPTQYTMLNVQHTICIMIVPLLQNFRGSCLLCIQN